MMPGWAKRYARDAIFKYRQFTWSGRGLPDCIVIGAQKSGTTSMFGYLGQHPQLLPSFRKEVHFFDGGLDPGVDNFAKGLPWYCAHFPLRRSIGAGQKMFEASPLYIFNPLAPRRIAALVPGVKIVALLRNPTERAISHYFHNKRSGQGREPLTIHEALQAEERRLEPVIGRQDYKNDAFIHHSYKRRGLYREQLERYFQCFPRDQILVMSSETFFAEPEACLERVFAFVGVDPRYKVENLMPRNVANNRSDVTPDVYEYLDRFFRLHNQELYEMMGEDYGW
jgi:hypothetical protein